MEPIEAMLIRPRSDVFLRVSPWTMSSLDNNFYTVQASVRKLYKILSKYISQQLTANYLSKTMLIRRSPFSSFLSSFLLREVARLWKQQRNFFERASNKIQHFRSMVHISTLIQYCIFVFLHTFSTYTDIKFLSTQTWDDGFL